MRAALLTLGLIATLASASPALACGDSEAGLSCDDGGNSAEQGARYMLKRVGTALATDKAGALDAFAKGTRGFRTADTYVFCVGPEGTFTAHPNPILQGNEAMSLHDKTGNYFIKTMIETAKPGEVQVIRYLFPKPGSTVAVPKTTYYTKTGDQMCGVGVYDGDDGKPVKAATAQERIAQLKQKLDAQMPQSARADWTAFVEALNADRDTRDAAVRQAREGLQAAEAALGSDVEAPAEAK